MRYLINYYPTLSGEEIPRQAKMQMNLEGTPNEINQSQWPHSCRQKALWLLEAGEQRKWGSLLKERSFRSAAGKAFWKWMGCYNNVNVVGSHELHSKKQFI